jgi:hypothetical protein
MLEVMFSSGRDKERGYINKTNIGKGVCSISDFLVLLFAIKNK